MRGKLPQVTSQAEPRTDTALAQRLGVSRAALAKWRTGYPDSVPRSRVVQLWEQFIAENGLGDRSHRRAVAPRGFASSARDELVQAECALRRAAEHFARANPTHAAKFQRERAAILERLETMHRLAGWDGR